jgi:hypothetical protein
VTGAKFHQQLYRSTFSNSGLHVHDKVINSVSGGLEPALIFPEMLFAQRSAGVNQFELETAIPGHGA